MHRIEGDDVDEDLFGTNKDGFTDGDPIAGVAATEVSDSWLNSVQEEIANAIESSSALSTAETDTRDQLDRVLRERAAFAIASSLRSVSAAIGTDVYLSITSQLNVVIAVGEDGRIMISEDFGATFTAETSGVSDDLHGIASSPPTGNLTNALGIGFTAVTVGAANAIKYRNYTVGAGAGGSWTTPSGPIAGAYTAVCFAGVTNQFVAVGANGLIARGTTGAWVNETIATSEDFICVASSADRVDGTNLGTVIAAGSNGTMYRSTDGGASWTLVTGFTSEAVEHLSFDTVSGRWWCSSGSNASVLAYSDDDGVTWTVLIAPSIDTTLSGICAIAGGVLVAEGTSEAVWFIPRSALLSEAVAVGECGSLSYAHYNHRTGLLALAGEADLLRVASTRIPGLR